MPLLTLPRLRAGALTVAALVGLSAAQTANAVVLTNATATFSQAGFSVGDTNNSDLSAGDGWAVAPNIVSQTAVWETQTDITGNRLDFQLIQNFTGPAFHLIGRFRLSTTTDDRSTFADGLASGGDVTANWTVLTAPVVSGPAGMTFTTLGDNSVLVGGSTPATGTYDVSYTGAYSNVTGVRLEVLEDASLPFNGPGRQPVNGNFVLTEITLNPTTVVPAPPANRFTSSICPCAPSPAPPPHLAAPWPKPA